jgi:hypothetical protein
MPALILIVHFYTTNKKQTIMKRLMAFFLLILIGFSSCKKDNNTPGSGNNNGGNGGGNNGGGGNGADITVATILPAEPYPDDQITITGSGFNPDATKDTLEFGDQLQGGFIYYTGGGTDNQTKIISATATKLVIEAVNYMDLDYDNFAIGSNLPKTRIRIKANGKKFVTDIIPFKHKLFINATAPGSILAKIQGCTNYIQPGDSISLDGSGFYKPGKIYLNNKEIPNVIFDPATITKCSFRIPKDIFSKTPEDNCTPLTATVKIVNADGKSYEREVTSVPSPPMVISSAKFEKADYTYGSDDHAMLTITGYSLYSTTMIRISSSNGYQYEGAATGISNYPNQSVQSLSLGGLPVPTTITTYNIQIKRMQSDDWGFVVASFKYHP